MVGNTMWLVRVVFMGVLLLFSFIEMALAAAYIAKVDDLDFSTPDFAGLALAISLITMLVISPMLAIDFVRRGAITSWVMVELAVTGVLMILWLATAATTAAADGFGATDNCGRLFGDFEMLCRTHQAIEAFAFLNWLLVLFYFGGLLTLSVIAQSRKNSPWQSSVRDMNFSGRSGPVPMTQQAVLA